MKILSLPGWQSSGPQHWQSLWERLDSRIERVEQADWEAPSLAAWSARLEAALTSPSVLIAHSIGCLLAVRARKNVLGALLVGPADVERLDAPAAVRGFAPIPLGKLPFPAVVVASTTDPFLSMSRAVELASAWGAELVDVGDKGHLNTASNLGTWSGGRALLNRLLAALPFELDARLVRDTVPAGESALCSLLLMNDSRSPWFMLVPRRSAISELHELNADDRAALATDSIALSEAMARVFDADKLNVAALGNVVRQLHVHHVVRRLDDFAWPGPVWGHSARVPYDEPQHVIDALFSDELIRSRFTLRVEPA